MLWKRTATCRWRTGLRGIALACCALTWSLFPAATWADESHEFFEKHVRPILVTHCQECHGEKKAESGLRLDKKAHALRGSDEAPVITPGKPAESPLVAAIRYEGDYEMPPEAKLSDDEIAVLTKWVEIGAPWPDDGSQLSDGGNPAAPEAIARAQREHWAFQPIKQPETPAVSDASGVRGPIDAFVVAQLESKNLRPSPPADKRTLLRRATYDLIGLPPTMAELREFEADTSPDAFAQVVDRLLASPAYGERWARHWLDVARYGDSQGYRAGNVETRYPYAYTYRDYVVQSFNNDLPYDQFVREQVAADHLPNPRPGSLAALGFLTVGARFNGGEVETIDDRIDVVTRGLLGLTVSCARCHDHKFDPIPTADYYSLYGVFYSSHEPEELPLLGEPADTPEHRAFLAELNKREQAVTDYIADERVKLLTRVRSVTGDFLLAALRLDYPERITREEKDRLTAADVQDRIARRWSGFLRRTVKKHDPIFTPFHRLAELPREEFASRAPQLLEEIWKQAAEREDRAINPRVEAALKAQPPKSLIELCEVYGRIFQEVDQRRTAQPAETPLEPADEALLACLYGAEAPADLPMEEIEPSFPVDVRNRVRELRGEVERWRIGSPSAPPRAMVLVDKPQPGDVDIFVRGNPHRRGERAPRRYLAVLSGDDRQPFQHGSGRGELAEKIASRDNPLTARVIVNRVWGHLFGEAIVRSAGNFGLQGDPPTHPALLDYLAARLMEQNWSLKKLQREILLSATYQQQSAIRADCQQLDPENRLLWRMNRKRLEFEPMRDSLLAAAGRLDRTVGGQPVNLATEPFTTRRTLYGLIDRERLFSTLPIFDFADPDSSSPGRPRTIVPQQALYLMNSPFVVEQAGHLAARSEVQRAAAPPDRVRVMYELVLTRAPEPDELEQALAFIESQSAAAPSDAQKLDAWQMLAQVLLLTNEALFVD